MSMNAALKAALPGLAFVVALAFAAKGISLASGGQLSSILCAVLFGILWRNVAGMGGWADPGSSSLRRLLRIAGIALIGLRLTFVVLTSISLAALPVVIACIAVALIATMVLGRLFRVAVRAAETAGGRHGDLRLHRDHRARAVLRSREQDIGIAIACVVLFGSLAMVAYPWIAHTLFRRRRRGGRLFFGASIQDTSQVVGAAMIYAQQFDAPDAVAIAGLTKFLRTFGLLMLVPAAAMWMARRKRSKVAAATGLRRGALPWFVIAFIALAGVRTAGDLWLDGPAWHALLHARSWHRSCCCCAAWPRSGSASPSRTCVRRAGARWPSPSSPPRRPAQPPSPSSTSRRTPGRQETG